MKVARFYAPGDIRVEEADEPSPSEHEVKIRVHACSTCGTDVKIFGAGHQNIDPPRVMGHEIAGEVVEVGSASRDGSRATGSRSSRRSPAARATSASAGA